MQVRPSKPAIRTDARATQNLTDAERRERQAVGTTIVPPRGTTSGMVLTPPEARKAQRERTYKDPNSGEIRRAEDI